MHIDIITGSAGDLLSGPFSHSIWKEQKDKDKASVKVHNLRDYATGNKAKVDDYCCAWWRTGMVMQIEA